MNELKKTLNWTTRTLLLVMVFFISNFAIAQQKASGTVYDNLDEPLFGATVLVLGTNYGTTTDENGRFILNEVPTGSILLISYVGFKSQQLPAGLNLSVTLSTDGLDEVIITGFFDERRALEASVSISTLGIEELDRIVPNSGVDVLKYVPGVYVNSALGEIKSNISTRGITAVTDFNNSNSGLYYVSLQEDGLPVSNIFLPSYSPDYVFRHDITVKRVEAVRGGTASIAGANAPGGIFNYISKTGGQNFGGSLRQRFGLEGDGQNFYTKTELDLGGPLGSGFYYNIGGFYRRSVGSRDLGYPSNYGGQLKFNISKKYDQGSAMFYVKYLNDHNAHLQKTLGKNFDDPQLIDGLSNTDAFVLPEGGTISMSTSDGLTRTFDPTILSHSKQFAAGFNWKHRFSESVSLTNNARFSSSKVEMHITEATTVASLTDIPTWGVGGLIGPQYDGGVINITNGGQSALIDVGFPPPSYTVSSNTLPSDFATNSVLFMAANLRDPKFNEFMNQFVLKIAPSKNLKMNVGTFLSFSDVPEYVSAVVGGGFGTVEHQPQLVDINFSPAGGGATIQYTSPQGYWGSVGLFGFTSLEYNKFNLAPFINTTWNITDKLTFDFGLRYESTKQKGTNTLRSATDGSDGGLDGDSNTLYDNLYFGNPTPLDYEFNNNTWSYSGALNYLISDMQSLYGRFSVGRKAPEGRQWTEITSQDLLNVTRSVPQEVTQFEIGYKRRTNNLDLAITPFYSLLGNVLNQSASLDENNILYQSEPFYNEVQTFGVELESNIRFTKNFNTRIAATIQTSKYNQFKFTDPGADGDRTDDIVVDYTGNKGELTPSTIFTIVPMYSTDKFYTMLTYNHVGSRYANVANAFKLSGYGQLDLAVGYDITTNLNVGLNVNNLFDGTGVVAWGAPGGFPATFNLNGFTKEDVQANKDAVFPILTIQPRAYFINLTYSF